MAEEPIVESLFDEETVANAFRDLLSFARDDDKSVRDEYLRVWTRLEYYWNNVLDIFLDPISHEWRTPDWTQLEDELPPRLINIFRPHGESIVAALSVTIPGVYFHPDDADKPEDVETARASRHIVELLQLHNEAAMLLIRCIVIMFTEGTIFGYNYEHTDKKFGYFRKPRVENKPITYKEGYCPECGNALDAAKTLEENYVCQECGYEGPPTNVKETTEELPQITGEVEHPKTSICQDIFSGTQVKVPAYARKLDECGYLLLEFVQAEAMLRNIFQDKASKINAKRYNTSWEQFSKLPLQYFGEMPNTGCNVSCLWLRPWQFWEVAGNNAEKKELVQFLQKTYPNGCYAIYIDDEFMEAYDEDMDMHWTASKNPLGKFIYSRPLSENLATVQDIRAQLVELELQTIEYGIPETYADPSVLDFTKYGQERAKPGMVTQARPKPGKSLQDAFHTTKTATLSQEVDPIRQHIDTDAQFVVGDFPSVYGGIATGGSKTAKEYTESRSAALQRLGTIWKIVSSFWAEFQGKSAAEYTEILKRQLRDERFTRKEGDNSINVWIRSSEMTGKIGRVEPESTEQLPQSWAQKKDVLMSLFQTGVEPILAVLTHPRNAGLIKDVMGLRELYVPGEDDRNRQVKEFSLLAQGINVPTQPMVDNDGIHIEVLIGLLEGHMGDTLDENGRNACMMHLQEHQMNAMQLAPPPVNAEQEQENVPAE